MNSMFLTFITAFGMGILASLTPCFYPMIPITISLIQAQTHKTFTHNFLCVVSYVLGIAMMYASLGYVAATTTVMFGEWMVNPWVVGFLVLFFLYLAFSMFGFYEMYTPRFLTKQHEVSRGGSFLYSFLFGVVSGTVASPCLTPALAGLLGYVAKEGNPILGFLTLFIFALGMGLILLVIGCFSGSLSLLPRAGMWMVEVRKFFGFVLLGVAVYFVQPLLPEIYSTVLYALLGVITLLYYGYRLLRKKKA